MEAFFDYIADRPSFGVEILLFLPAVAIFREEGWDRIGREEFACYLAGYLIALLVVVLILGFLAGSDLPGHWLVLIAFPALVVLCLCQFWMYYFYESVVQRARDAGHGRTIAYISIVPPLNLAVFAYLLWRPSVSPATFRAKRRRRRRRMRRLQSWIAALPRPRS